MSVATETPHLTQAVFASISDVPHMMAFDTGRYLIAAVLMFAIVWGLKKTAFAYRTIQSRVAQSEDYRREFWASIRTCAVYSAVGIFVSLGVRTGVLQEVQASLGLWTDLALFGAIIVAHDAYFYWSHRSMHHPKLFKTFHRLHHRSITPTPFAAYAFNVPEAVVMALFLPLWLLFVPTPATVIFSFLAFMIIRNVMGHSGFETFPRWWLQSPLTRWINTTVHHDLHHLGGFNRNYGLYFTWWDKICGTEHEQYAETFERVVAKPTEEQTPAKHAQTV